MISACRSLGWSRAPAGRLGANEQILVDVGDSSQASYSPRGDQLVFVSAGRPGHAQPQAYVRDASGNERRVTFSNGAVQRPRFHPREAAIVYASSTDELKEVSPLLRGLAAAAPKSNRPPYLSQPSEVYVHGLDSYAIDRLSTHAGFDGQPNFSADGRTVSWTSAEGERTLVRSVNRATGATRVLQGLGLNASDYVVAPDLTASAWLEYGRDFASPRLRVRRHQETRTIAAERADAKYDLSFAPDSRWLFWSEFDPTTQVFRPISLEVETGCVRKLPFIEGASRRDPVLSPDGQWLTYTLVGSDKSRIARAPFNPRPGPCPTQP